MSELRDIIALEASTGESPRRIANSVLAMPELVAIREALKRLHDERVREYGEAEAYDWLTMVVARFPSVVAWVLEGGPSE